MIRIIALLGNPGTQYRRTRHNVAWLFGAYCGWDDLSWQAKYGTQYADTTRGTTRLTILKPQKFMNRSGESIAQFARYKRIDAESILIVHDDVDLAFGEVVTKSGGGLGGHNGLRSLSDRLGTRAFPRLRIGVGRPNHGSVASYVLGSFSKHEEQDLPGIFYRAERLLDELF